MKDNRDNKIAFSPTAEQKTLLHLLAVALGAERSPLSKQHCAAVDWEQVAKESVHQTVCPLVFEAASVYEVSIPPNVFERWFSLSYGYLRYAHATFESQRHLAELMNENGCKFVILKGTAAAAYYPAPEKRCFGDVDFLIDPAQRETVERLLIADGYARSEDEHDCHVVFRKQKEHLEMHYAVTGIPYGKLGDAVREYLHYAVHTPVNQTVGDVTFPSPQPHHHAVILLLHMQHHTLGEGLGLRHLCDWAVFVDRTASEPFWQESVLPFVKEIGLFTYAAAMTKTAARHLGTACPPWAQAADDSLCDSLMQDILLGGNFGRKDEMRAASGMLISEHGKAGTQHGAVYNLAHTLHTAVLLQYPVIKKLPLLYPFLYGYKVIRFCVLRLMGKRLSLTKRIPYATERKQLYTKLKVFEIKDDEVT